MHNPVTFERIFRVRHYECDAYGHMNHANYLRLMQETATDASAAVGYSATDYETMKRVWFIRETQIRYLQPAQVDDQVAVKTWVVDFRRVRSRRQYELRRVADGELLAEAMTDWVFLDRERNRPVSIPPAMITAFLPNGPDPNAPPRTRFPDPPPPPADCFEYHTPIQWRDIDQLQHLNNANYLAYFEEASMHVCAAHGWPVSRMMAEQFGIIAREYWIEYLQPAGIDDSLCIQTWASDMRRATAYRHYDMRRTNGNHERIARARAKWVWVDLTNHKPIKIPAGFRADFSDNIVG